jgi:hypothetical protein
MHKRFRLLTHAVLLAAVIVPPALADLITTQPVDMNLDPASIDLQTINKYFNPADCAGGMENGFCQVKFAGSNAVKDVYLTVITYDPDLIPDPGQIVTVKLGETTRGYLISPGGSLIECYGATVPGPAYGGGKGMCESGSPAKNTVAGIVTFPDDKRNIYLFTGNMEEKYTTQGGLGAQPSYVEYRTLYSELNITMPNLGIGTTPIMISTPGVTGYFRKITGGNERLFLIEPVPEPSTFVVTLGGLGFIAFTIYRRRPRPRHEV